MRRLPYILVLAFIILSLVTGCGDSDNTEQKQEGHEGTEPIELKLGMPKAPPTLPLLRMMETNALGGNVKLELAIWESTENMIAMASDDSYPIMAVPVNVGAQLYNKGINIKLANVNTWGVIYLVSSDPAVKDWADLRGKAVYIAFKGAPPDMITKYLLQEKGLTPGEDVEMIYSTPAEVAQLLKGGKIQNAVNIEPFIQAGRSEGDNIRIIAGYGSEWRKIQGDEFDLPNAGIVFKDKFINEHRELADKFQAEYEKALKWTVENPGEAGALAEKHLGFKKELIEKAMPNLALKYKSAIDAKAELEKYYNVLSGFEVQCIGGKLPDEAFYYGK
ncbi:ABC transporter substrate-binding protein [Desulfoscipio sp. XC116]|uniref:ABC transporter substrate-binding protein n=1 Tax=Desulfoscipio sp. XC116 TaxID=3144975 RepID=UPI00325B07BC